MEGPYIRKNQPGEFGFQIHYQAHLQIFQAALKKIPGEQETKNRLYGELQNYVKEHIREINQFDRHVPHFARIIGVKPEALSRFLQSNLTRSIELVREKMGSSGSTESPSTSSNIQEDKSVANVGIMAEIFSRTGISMMRHGRFVAFEAGMMKLITDDGEIFPTSFNRSSETADAAKNGVSDSKDGSPSDKKNPEGVTQKPVAIVKTNPIPKKPVSASRQPEKPIINEIIERLGSSLSIKGKLVLANGIEAPAEGDPGNIPVIALDFQTYINYMKVLREHQTSRDDNRYRSWLKNEAGVAGRGIVALKNLESKERSGASLDWQTEYRNLTQYLENIPHHAIEALHIKIRAFSKIQKIMNELKNRVTKREPRFVAIIKKIWHQVMALFYKRQNEKEYAEHLKGIVEGLPVDERLPEVLSFFEPAFHELAENYRLCQD